MSYLSDYLARYRGRKVAVIGAGISNTPLIEALAAERIDTTVRDRRTREQLGEPARRFEASGIKLKPGDGYLDNLSEDVIFRTPGLMPHIPALRSAVSRGAELTSEMEAFFEICPCRIIGITGSDGKTTTTAIIAGMLESQGRTVHTGGNIGMPLLCKADEMNDTDIAVVELSSFQLITMRRSPDIAVITNISPNHLDIHNDFDEYIQAKCNIFKYQRKDARSVFNYDNAVTRKFAETAPAGDVLFFSSSGQTANGVYLENGKIINASAAKTVIMNTSDILLPGTHNVENYMAACAALSGIVSTDTMRKTARTFQGVRHRLELISRLGGVRYYNDSIASSPTRTIAGLRSFAQKVILIAGGKDKGLAFDELGTEIVKRVKKLVLTGMAAGQIQEAVVSTPGYDGMPEIVLLDGFEDAVMEAARSAESGDIVLLSPACTSFDAFKNFEERGDRFREIVNGL